MKDYIRRIPPYYENQEATLDLLGKQDRVLDLSDPGTGKTRPALGAYIKRLEGSGKRCLVLATKSILQSAWGDEIDKFFPGVSYDIAYANKRKERLLKSRAPIVITNHDAVRALVGKQSLVPLSFWNDFDTIIVDESTAFKNHGSQRSKALYSIAKRMEFRECMTGTPQPQVNSRCVSPSQDRGRRRAPRCFLLEIQERLL